MAIAIKGDQRPGKTKGELRQLRLAGRIPGVVYGKQLQAPIALSVEERELSALLRTTPNAVLELDIPAHGKQTVMIADVQRDPLYQTLLHIDFQGINMNEKVRANVRIEATGDSSGVREGGILQTILHEVEVQCLPGDIPDALEADVSSLGIGENLLIQDLVLPKGIEVVAEPTSVVLTVLAPQKELTEEEKEAQDVESMEAESRSDHAQHKEISTST
jgi:large subunit ribosomal protein L25